MKIYPYSLAQIGEAQGWFDPTQQSGTYAEQWQNAPQWAQRAMELGLTQTGLTANEYNRMNRAYAQGRGTGGVNPFARAAPNPYTQDDRYTPLQNYAAANPLYANQIQQDPGFANYAANMRGDAGAVPASQGGAGVTPGYRWSDAKNNPLMSPMMAPYATHIGNEMNRAKWNSEQLRNAILGLTGRSEADNRRAVQERLRSGNWGMQNR